MRHLWSEDRLSTAVWGPTATNKTVMSPPAISFVAKIFSPSPAISCFAPTLHHSASSLWYWTRKTCCYHAHSSCSTCTCTSSSKTQLGSGPPPHQFESHPLCIGMDTPMIEFYFILFFISTIDFFWPYKL
jgi:hypothetical protein